MRLFVSIRPSPQAVAHLAAALAGQPSSRPDQWHVTLAFLGDVTGAEQLYDGLRDATARASSFALRVEGGGVFPGARVVWAGVGGDLDRLSALAADVQHACRSAGVALDRRRFRPHLTVGKTGRLDPAVLRDYSGPPWQVREVELVHSVLGRTATHTVLERFPLYQA